MPRRKARTPDERERELVGLATDLAEKQLREGNASPSVLTHYLKLATEREKLERRKLEKEMELMTAKRDAIDSAQRIEELYDKAIAAMRSYSSPGIGTSDEDDV